MAETTAGTEGPDWSAKAPLWAELWAHLPDPAREVVARATSIGAGTRVLESLATAVGLEPGAAREVDVPYEAPDQDTLVRALMMEAPGADPDDVRRVLDGAGERFRRPDGSYRFENRFRFLIATA